MKKLFVLAALLFAVNASAQTTRTYTLSFNHDGVNTDSYAVTIDGTRTTITPACTGSGDTRLCTSPLTMTYGVEHNVVVTAVGPFGESSAVPFLCTLPKVPNNQKVGR